MVDTLPQVQKDKKSKYYLIFAFLFVLISVWYAVSDRSTIEFFRFLVKEVISGTILAILISLVREWQQEELSG